MALEGFIPGAVHRGNALCSIKCPEASVSVLCRFGGLEVIEVEVQPGASLSEPMLWNGLSWHLVIEGEAGFEQAGQKWELLPRQSLYLDAGVPYAVSNPSPGKLKVLTLVFNSDSDSAEERR